MTKEELSKFIDDTISEMTEVLSQEEKTGLTSNNAKFRERLDTALELKEKFQNYDVFPDIFNKYFNARIDELKRPIY